MSDKICFELDNKLTSPDDCLNLTLLLTLCAADMEEAFKTLPKGDRIFGIYYSLRNTCETFVNTFDKCIGKTK